ncbi:hypothetical protein [Streptomyces wuyuanensis]|uniref:hypothetical protein n=1 Tax=Streptomyces wuyuanensis TaxID=1196353 RepID=UPI0036787311
MEIDDATGIGFVQGSTASATKRYGPSVREATSAAHVSSATEAAIIVRRAVSAKKGDRVGQIEGEPRDPAVVDTLVACVRPGADLHHGSVGVCGQEVRHPTVEEQGAQHCAGEAGKTVEACEVVVDRGDDLLGPGVAQKGKTPCGSPRRARTAG